MRSIARGLMLVPTPMRWIAQIMERWNADKAAAQAKVYYWGRVEEMNAATVVEEKPTT